ncbi:hypothetical protein K227x_29990 [Rubripirellula lacrimiformis]|uniref:Uncharacterized protein n=1 Tax=Rubripirellula lacrimiformis TaxID=1930273 RepID=A0A517NBU5_9BACT|nr:DUF1583 domain-containing protein [Rubripirellula lacrimiformis]QDT04606.1 hypothetical protein K227x_29990 [Rubripirellula lacrimiformis]
MLLRILLIAFLIMLSPARQPFGRGKACASDRDAAAVILGEPLLRQSTVDVSTRGKDVAPSKRYPFLKSWVMPMGTLPPFRVTAELQSALDLGRQPGPMDDGARFDLADQPESKWLCSPAADLVAEAQSLGRIAELQTDVDQWQANTATQRHQKWAMQSLIAIAVGDVDLSTTFLDDLLAVRPQDRSASPHDVSMRELLVVRSAAEHHSTRHLVTEEWLRSVCRHGINPADFHLRSLADWCKAAEGTKPVSPLDASSLFLPCSRLDSQSDSSALPIARYGLSGEIVVRTTGGPSDFLAFQSPLQGDYAVSAEVLSRPFCWTSLLVAGRSVRPDIGAQTFQLFSMDAPPQRLSIPRQFEPLGEWTQVRVEVHDGMASHYVNGIETPKVKIDEASFPWFMLHSIGNETSAVRSVRVTGTPTIPAQLNLVASTRLSGWSLYHRHASGSWHGNWDAAEQDGRIVLSADADPLPHGSSQEDLLRYDRPILEDGWIEYEFWQPDDSDEAEVHPALGRQVIMIGQNEVTLHRLTNGMEQRSLVRPDNRWLPDFASSRGAIDTAIKPPTLQPAAWNRAKLSLTGDRLALFVNGDLVLEQAIEASNSRHFGFFRFADRHHSAVRDVRYTGDWPKQLPAMQQQPLVSRKLAELEEWSAALPQSFDQDFRKPLSSFDFDANGDQQSLALVPLGVKMHRTTDQGIRDLRSCVRVTGDFDITAKYCQLNIKKGKPTWHCGIGLAVLLDDSQRNYFAIHHRTDRMNGQQFVTFVRKEMNDGGKTTFVDSEQTSDQGTSGTLRLMRRDDWVYAYYAQRQSKDFRLISTAKVSSAPIEIQGVRLMTEVGMGLSTSVVWQSLRIRADSIDPMIDRDPESVIAYLDQLADYDSDEFETINQDAFAEGGRWGVSNDGESSIVSDQRATVATAKGAPGHSAIYHSLSCEADFDLSVDFDPLEFPKSEKPGAANEITWQIRLAPHPMAGGGGDDSPEVAVVEASFLLRHKWNGLVELVARTVGINRAGKPMYRPIRSISVNSPDRYRFVKRGSKVYFLYSERDSETDRLIATCTVDPSLIVQSNVLGIIATAPDHPVQTRWNRFTVKQRQPSNDATDSLDPSSETIKR